MENSELDMLLERKKPRKFYLGWTFPILIRPKKTLEEVITKEQAVWIGPLVLLSICAALFVLASASLPQQIQPQVNSNDMGYEYYYSPEQQELIQEAASSGVSPLFSIGFPLAGKLLGIWAGWLFLGIILHLVLTISGNRSENKKIMNITAWAMIPIAIRFLVQAAVVLISRQTISGQGLSGFAPTEPGVLNTIFQSLLGQIDIYLIWQVLLLITGTILLSSNHKTKSFLSVLISVLLIMLLSSVPAIIGSQLSGLAQGSFYF